MNPSLHISREISLPANDIAGKKIAILGTTGSGKTFAAMKLAEELLGAGIQTVALDVVGVWYGLRVSKDGKGRGFPIVVFGGLHGDIPITPDSGALVADIVVDRNISAVIDISQMDSDAEAGRFATAFAKQLFQRRKSKPAVTIVFLEECQEFVPENPVGGSENMKLHAFTRMVKIGRNFGIGVVLISQRPQEVSKRALNLSECVFAFQMNGRSEREAVKKWLRDSGADDVDVDVLPTLPVGVAHLWSPRWLKISRQVHILPKKTYDSSGTPDFDMPDGVVVRPLLPADIEKITASMAATIEKAKADDPTELRKKIARLDADLKSATSRPGHSDPEAIKREFDRGVDSVKKILGKDISRHRMALVKIKSEYVSAFDAAFKVLNDAPSRVAAIEMPAFLEIEEAAAQAKSSSPQIKTQLVRPASQPPVRTDKEVSPKGHLPGPEQRILNAIAWLESLGIETPEQVAVAFLAGYTTGGGGYNNPRGKLKTLGLIEYIPGDKLKLTKDGREHARYPETALTNEELQRRVMDRLPGPEKKILRVILDAYPEAITNEACAMASGYTEGGGGYNNPRGRLRTLGLIEYVSGGLRARDILFPA